MADFGVINHASESIKTLLNHDVNTTNVTQNTGGYKGQNVSTIPSLQSILHAAEELSFKAAELRSTDLSKKKVKDKVAEALKTEESTFDYIDSVNGTEKADEITRTANMLSNQTFLNQQELKNFLQFNLKDISDQFAALVLAKKLITGELQLAGTKKLINNLINQFIDKQSPEIKSGINIYETAKQYEGKSLGNLQNLRNFYRDTILNYKSLSVAYKEIIANYGDQKIQNAIAFLLQGLGVELKINSASLEKFKLRQILDDLKKLKILNTLMEQVGLLFSRVIKPSSDKQDDKEKQ